MLLYIISISVCIGFAYNDDTVCLLYFGSCYYFILPTQSCQYYATKCIACNADIDCTTSYGLATIVYTAKLLSEATMHWPRLCCKIRQHPL